MFNIFERIFNKSSVKIDLDDIQAIILRKRPIPYFGTNVMLHIENAQAGKDMIRKLLPLIPSADNWHLATDATVTLVFSYEGLKALGLPADSLESFPESFKQGMAARAKNLHDVDENAPQHWEKPFGTSQVHAGINIIADTTEKWQRMLQRAEAELREMQGIKLLFKADFSAVEEAKNVFGFRDGISNPEIEGSGLDEVPGYGRPVKAGEFILGYPGEAGAIGYYPQPSVLGKNGSFLVFRKYHSKVYQFNQFLKANAHTEDEQELLAAKMFGRWRSGAPLILAPKHDDQKIGDDRLKNNDFSYKNDPNGKIVPLSCHMRRMNPRDTKLSVISDINLHRIIRKGVSYGDAPAKGVTTDDGIDRGLYFIAISAKAMDTVEFLQSQWINDGNFINHSDEKDPIIGLNQGQGIFTVPETDVRKRYHAVETFNVMKGGEYFFVPGLKSLQWMTGLS